MTHDHFEVNVDLVLSGLLSVAAARASAGAGYGRVHFLLRGPACLFVFLRFGVQKAANLADASISCSIAVNSTSSLNLNEQFDAGCASVPWQPWQTSSKLLVEPCHAMPYMGRTSGRTSHPFRPSREGWKPEPCCGAAESTTCAFNIVRVAEN